MESYLNKSGGRLNKFWQRTFEETDRIIEWEADCQRNFSGTDEQFRRLLSTFGVARSFSAGALAREIAIEFRQSLPAKVSVVEAGEAADKLALLLKEKDCTHHIARSAASKLLSFIDKESFPRYDSFARRGLGTLNFICEEADQWPILATVSEFCRLHNATFTSGRTKELHSHLVSSGHPEFALIMIDWFLMKVGGSQR